MDHKKNENAHEATRYVSSEDINEDSAQVSVEKIPFNFKKMILTFKTVNTPSAYSMAYAVVSIVLLFAAIAALFHMTESFAQLPQRLTTSLGFVGNIGVYGFIFLFIITLGISFFLVKSTPDTTSNYVEKNKLAGLYQVISYFAIIVFLVLAAGIYA